LNPGVACIAVLTAIIGCGGGGETHHPVAGRVTLDDQPLTGADIAFLPQEPAGEALFGVTDAEGNYELRRTQSITGAPAGEYRVRISTYRAAKEGAESPEPRAPERVPPRYNLKTELTAHIEPGENTCDFKLLSQPGP
jgi:hypothetical protein